MITLTQWNKKNCLLNCVPEIVLGGFNVVYKIQKHVAEYPWVNITARKKQTRQAQHQNPLKSEFTNPRIFWRSWLGETPLR